MQNSKATGLQGLHVTSKCQSSRAWKRGGRGSIWGGQTALLFAATNHCHEVRWGVCRDHFSLDNVFNLLLYLKVGLPTTLRPCEMRRTIRSGMGRSKGQSHHNLTTTVPRNDWKMDDAECNGTLTTWSSSIFAGKDLPSANLFPQCFDGVPTSKWQVTKILDAQAGRRDINMGSIVNRPHEIGKK